jgi:hypothetical protein
MQAALGAKRIGKVLSEGDTPNLQEVRILLTHKLPRYALITAPASSEGYALALRVVNFIERDPYASADAMALQTKLPPGVSIVPGIEVPGRHSVAITQPIAMMNLESGEVGEPNLPAKPGADAYLLEDPSIVKRYTD